MPDSPMAQAILKMLSSVCIKPDNNQSSLSTEESTKLSRSPSQLSRLPTAQHHPNHGQPHHHHKPFNYVASKSVIGKRRLSDDEIDQQQQYYAYSSTLKKIQNLKLRSNPGSPINNYLTRSKSSNSANSNSSSTTGTSTATRHRKKVVINPYDKNQLNERIQTFNILTWTIDDTPTVSPSSRKQLNPLEIASRGWANHSKIKNEIYCTSCNALMLIKLNEISQQQTNIAQGYSIGYGNLLLNDELEDDVTGFGAADDDTTESAGEVRRMLIESYFSRLISDHYPECIWRSVLNDKNCGGSAAINYNEHSVTGEKRKCGVELIKQLYYFKFNQIEEIILNFDNNLNILKQFENNILGGPVRFKKLDYLTDYNEIISIVNNYANSDSKKDKYNIIILMISLLGWVLKRQKFGDTSLFLLNCNKCTRRILLGEAKSSSNLSGVEELSSCKYPPAIIFDDDDEFENDEEDDQNEEIDLIQEHEDWCCYVDGKPKGYEVILKCLASNTAGKLDEEGDAIMHDHEDATKGYNFDDSMAMLKSLN